MHIEENYQVLRQALQALPTYTMPDVTWYNVEKEINVPNQITTIQSEAIWANIEKELPTATLQLPEYNLPKDIWHNIEGALDTEENIAVKTSTTAVPKMKINYLKRNMAVAAAVAILIGFGSYFVLFSNNIEATMLTFDGNNQKELQLADGSTVTSESNAQLMYPAKFNGNTREVTQTSGTAFYEISRDTNKPFIINSQIANITVLGTSFTTAVSKDSFEVIVKTGKVKIIGTDHAATLVANERIIFFANGKAPYYVNADTTKPQAKAEPLIFTNKSVVDIIEEIKKICNCTIVYDANTIGKKKISGKIIPASAEQMLSSMCIAADLQLTKKGDQYIINK